MLPNNPKLQQSRSSGNKLGQFVQKMPLSLTSGFEDSSRHQSSNLYATVDIKNREFKEFQEDAKFKTVSNTNRP